MKVKFLSLNGVLPPNILKLGYSTSTEFHLETGRIYTVYGIMMWKSVIHYLIIPTDLTVPNWLPSDLFDIDDPRLPYEWYFSYLGDSNPNDLKFVLGYKEMIMDKKHYVNLIEREDDAIRIFLKRKKEIDEAS